jgi:hypothetical protein
VLALGEDLSPAWDAARRYALARSEFQRGVAALEAARRDDYSPTHDALAEHPCIVVWSSCRDWE